MARNNKFEGFGVVLAIIAIVFFTHPGLFKDAARWSLEKVHSWSGSGLNHLPAQQNHIGLAGAPNLSHLNDFSTRPLTGSSMPYNMRLNNTRSEANQFLNGK